MAEGVERAAWDRAALLWQAIAEPHRDHKKDKKPYLPSNVHPYRDDEWYISEDDDEPDWATLRLMLRNHQRNGNGHR